MKYSTNFREEINASEETAVASGRLDEQASLKADRAELERFVRIVFGGATPGAYISLRAFFADSKPMLSRPATVRVGDEATWLDEVVEVAVRYAEMAANTKRPGGCTFCPPPCTFRDAENARKNDIGDGLALVVDCDHHPDAALAMLRKAFGEPTLIIASGGVWIDPLIGESQDKLHLYYALSEPARTKADHARLEAVRKIACALIEGDPSGTPINHPMRWPGSWHTKAAPRLCRIVGGDEHRRIDLKEAERLAAPFAAKQSRVNGTGNGHDATHTETEQLWTKVARGEDLHDSTTRLAYRLLKDGTPQQAALQQLCGAMKAFPEANRDDRWRQRFGDLPRCINSAAAKLEAERNETPKPTSVAEPDDARFGPPLGEARQPSREIKCELWSDIEPGDSDDLVAGVLPREGLGALWAPIQAGKSALALDISARLAAGEEVFGEQTERVGVVYCAFEGAPGVRKRIKALRQQYGEHLPFILIPTRCDLRNATNEDVKALIDKICEKQPVLRELGAAHGFTVIDTFAAATPGMTENASEGMTAVVGALQTIQESVGGFVLINAHPGKDETKGLRGHSSLGGALETTIEIVCNAASPVREVWLRKQKDDASNRSLATFTIRGVEIGKTKKGRAITGAVIDYGPAPEATSKGKRKKPRPSDEAMLVAVNNALSNHGQSPPAYLHNVVSKGVTVVRRNLVIEEAQRLGVVTIDVTIEDTIKARKKMLDAANKTIKNLVGQGIITCDNSNTREGWIWLCCKP